MISWNPSCSMLRNFHTGVIRIPLGSLFSNFKLDCIKVEKDEIVIHMLEKNHFLLDKDAFCVRVLGKEQGYSDEYKDRQTLQ